MNRIEVTVKKRGTCIDINFNPRLPEEYEIKLMGILIGTFSGFQLTDQMLDMVRSQAVVLLDRDIEKKALYFNELIGAWGWRPWEGMEYRYRND